jgi:hypothetical protein
MISPDVLLETKVFEKITQWTKFDVRIGGALENALQEFRAACHEVTLSQKLIPATV